jgi:HK97 family phage major capsid protein
MPLESTNQIYALADILRAPRGIFKMSSNLVQKLEKMGQSLETFIDDNGKTAKDLSDRLESLESLQDRPLMTSATKKSAEVKVAIERFFRSGDKIGLAPYQAGFDEKAMSISTDSAGGYTHIPELADQILAAVGEVVPMFKDCRQVTTDSNEFRQIFTVNSPSAARAAESGSRSATDTPILARVDVPLFDLFSFVSVSNELLDSSQFDISAYLQTEIERQFSAAIEEEISTGSGSGSQQALGILTQATSTTADNSSPERAFTLYQRLALGVNSPLSSFNYGSLVQLAQALPVRYRRNAKFYASTGAIQAMRGEVDDQSRPIWLDANGGISGRPQSIMGYEVVEAPALPAVAAGNMPVVFGDLAQAYLWVSHERGLRVIRDDITTPGSTKFYVSLQCGGMPGDTRALKALFIG